MAGLLGDPSYNRSVDRSVLVGPMYGWDPVFMSTLVAPRNGLTIRYSALHGIFDGVDEDLRRRLQEVERQYHVAVLYGTRTFGSFSHEVLLVDASNPNMEPVNGFKFYLWRNYALDCGRYEHDGEFNLFVTIAQPLLSAVRALAPDEIIPTGKKAILAHEWMGMPFVFAAQMIEPGAWRSIFYAHETATARRIVEDHGGHDTRFYNVLDRGLSAGMYMDDLFGNQDEWHKAALVYQAASCDRIFAVGDRVVDELRFMSGAFRYRDIDLVYNGAPQQTTTPTQKADSAQRMREYAAGLLGMRPDYVFTHVARMNLSKAFWRDLKVLDHLAPLLAANRKTAVLFVLATSLPSGRQPEWVYVWEKEYGWPIGHRADNGDLVDEEVAFFFHGVEPFNLRHPNVKCVFVNQFGWSREHCGLRMPEDMDFLDIRCGSDLEFGQSIYEPFGIAQVEPLAYGALTCPSTACGCIGYLEKASQVVEKSSNIVTADYLSTPPDHPIDSAYDALYINHGTRTWVEDRCSRDVAREIARQLPDNDLKIAALLESGRALADAMSWEHVVNDYFLPAIGRAFD